MLPWSVERWIRELGDAPLRFLSSGTNKDSLWLHLSLLDSISAKTKVLQRTLSPMKLPAPNTVSSVYQRESPFLRLLGPTLEKRFLYFGYVSSRIVHHARLILPTLWAGVRLWWPAKT